MYSLYKFEESGSTLLTNDRDAESEYEAIENYLKSINKKGEGFRFLGELSGMVYRMNFKMSVDGIEDEYMIIHNTL